MKHRTIAFSSLISIFCITFFASSLFAQRGPQPTTPKEADVAKVEAVLPDSAPAKPEKPRKVLIFGHAGGFVHSSIPLGCKTIELIGKKTGAYDSVISFDPALFDKPLDEFDGIVLVSTTGDFLNDRNDKEKSDKRRQALLSFVEGGKGIVGIHAAGDAYYDWLPYGEMMGGYFSRHERPDEKISVVNEDPKNPINAPFDGKGFEFADEIYRFLPDPTKLSFGHPPAGAKQVYDRSKLHILLSIDASKHNNPPAGADLPVAWCHEVGKGRVFYCSLGHNDFVYYNPTIQKYYLAGIQYAVGDLKADDKPGEKTASAK